MLKRIVLIATVHAVILTFLFGCGSDTEPATDIITSDNADTSVAINNVEPPLPVKNFDGYVFNVLSFTRGTPGSSRQHLDFAWSSDAAGTPINDAVYNRNLIVEERYNVTIKNTENDDPLGTGKKAILAGEDDFDILMPYIDGSFTLAQEGLLVDFVTMPGIDIYHSWWDAAIIRDLSLGWKLYVITGDISMADEELNYGIFFNKALAETHNIDDCYQFVRDDKWNIDTMITLAASVTYDLNGDGIIDENDVYGLLTDYSVAPVWFFSSGGQMAALKPDGSPQIMMGDEKTLTIMEKLAEMFRNKEAVLNATETEGSWTGFDKMLISDRALFRAGSIYDIPFYRDMINDFGVLPYPKFDEYQKDYYHIIATQVCPGICVPITASDLSRTGLLLDALASESKDTVTKAYYDINLYTKLARDEESGEMFDIIFATKRYDLAKTFKWGGLEDVIRNSVKAGQNFASLYTAAEAKAITEMEKSYEIFK